MEYVPLFQEQLRAEGADPFWMLVGCSLVNLTSWNQARPVFNELRRACDDKVWKFKDIPLGDLVEILRPLGLQNRRAKNLHEMAVAWQNLCAERLYEDDVRIYREDILELPGCGRYAADSWAIFEEGDLTVIPSDGRLMEYLEHNGKINGNA